MNRVAGFWTRLKRVFFRRRFDQEMAAEMQSHIELETERRIALGEDPTTARRRAAAEFGSIDARTEEVRDGRLGAWLDHFLQDTRFALRMMMKSPGFTGIAIATLAIGIGANTAIFSAVDAVLLRPLPYPEPDRLLSIHEVNSNGNRNSVSGAAFLDWRTHQTEFDALTIYTYDLFDLTEMGDPEKLQALSVSHGFSEVFGLPPLRGRDFSPADETVGGNNNVVILTEAFWRNRFGSSESAIGKSLVIDGDSYEIIGVFPQQIWHNPRVEVFVPHVLETGTYKASHQVHRSQAIGRLSKSATPASGLAQLNAIKADVEDTYPDFKQGWGVGIAPFQSVLAEESRPFLLILLAAVSLVLLIACANVANLMLARTNVRQREIALRSALGASNGRIMRQVITESLILALLGGVAGVVVAEVSLNILSQLSEGMLPATMSPKLDTRVLGFSLLASCGTGLLFGIAPAWRSQNADPNTALKNNSSGSTDAGRNRSQSALIVAEVALTTVLLIATGFLVRDLVRTVTASPGFNPDNVLLFDLTMPYGGPYQGGEARMEFLAEVRQALSDLPGVTAVATTDDLPFGADGQGYFYSLEEAPETRTDRSGRIKYVSEDYFELLGARMIRGRPIGPADNRTGSSKVMVINQALARTLFGENEDPIGRLINASEQTWEVIGVVADMRIDSLHKPPPPTFFVPHWEFPWYSNFMIRTEGDPLAMAKTVSATVHRFDPNLPLDNIDTLASRLEFSLGPQKLILRLIGAFAITALTLACVGFYGVMSYSVASRRRELSIRMALGAAAADMVKLVLGGGARLLAGGLVIGMGLSMVALMGLGALLPEVNKFDPLVLGTTILTLSLVTVSACWLPARKAATANPIDSLRAE